jgi:hypothetical protein
MDSRSPLPDQVEDKFRGDKFRGNDKPIIAYVIGYYGLKVPSTSSVLAVAVSFFTLD